MQLPQLDVVVLNGAHSGAGASLIREKLVELYDKLLGVEVTPHSPDVNSAFRLLVDAMEQAQAFRTRVFSAYGLARGRTTTAFSTASLTAPW